jgi:hypothetical protein
MKNNYDKVLKHKFSASLYHNKFILVKHAEQCGTKTKQFKISDLFSLANDTILFKQCKKKQK